MWIEFFADERLRYTSRRRYVSIPNDIQPIERAMIESFLYGDGLTTELVWNIDNSPTTTIEDSWIMKVTYLRVATCFIDDNNGIHYGKWHRWFITGYQIESGGCARFQLLRDVVGEFGLDGIYGKIERGFAKGIFEHRKELSLNQILTGRQRLVSDAKNYGTIKIKKTPDAGYINELWGILYMKKPAPLPGSTEPASYNIPIPGFAPQLSPGCPDNLADVDEDLGHAPYQYISQTFTRLFQVPFILKIRVKEWIFTGGHHGAIVWKDIPENYVYCDVRFNYIGNGENVQFTPTDGIQILSITPITEMREALLGSVPLTFNVDIDVEYNQITDMGMMRRAVVEYLAKKVGEVYKTYLVNGRIGDIDVHLPSYEVSDVVNWNGSIYSKTEDNVTKYYQYTSHFRTDKYRNESLDSTKVNTILDSIATTFNFQLTGYVTWNSSQSITCTSTTIKNNPNTVKYQQKNYTDYKYRVYETRELTPEESGTLAITPNEDFVDEPYKVIITPLFNCKLEYDGTDYIIDRNKAFNVFNHVIEASSGENSYLVDAQIYPYCPIASSLVGSFNVQSSTHALFFSVASTSYEHNIHISLDAAVSQVPEGGMPYNDIKKTYMTRLYSIVSPDKSAKFDFNLYDYKDILSNFDDIVITIKTALKPFAIISSAIVQPEAGSLIGMAYDSDMRGCNPSSGGFECSIATNMFEQYKRQNCNYQQIFALQKGELQVSHEVERVNEKANAIVNSMTATAMGAIGGGAVGGTFGPIGKGIGAAVGGIAAGATVGTAMGLQYKANERLRNYEENLQQQHFDLQIGTVKNLPNSVTRISSFNEIIMSEFNYYVETYVCSPQEEVIVDEFRRSFGDQIGVLDYYTNHYKPGCFLRGTVIRCNLLPSLQTLLIRELEGGIYYYGLTSE